MWAALSLVVFLVNVHDFPTDPPYSTFSIIYLSLFTLPIPLRLMKMFWEDLSDYYFYKDLLDVVKYVLPTVLALFYFFARLSDYFGLKPFGDSLKQSNVKLWGFPSLLAASILNFVSALLSRAKVLNHSLNKKSDILLLLLT